MNLLQIRTKFIDLSGRHDLVADVTSYVDNGANVFIQEGQKWLDRMLDTGPTKAKLFSDLAAGGWYVLMENCRAIYEVWSNDGSDRVKLEKASVKELREYYYAEPSASADQGTPAHYAIGTTRTSPITDNQITIDSFYGAAITSAADEFTYKTLLIGPPADDDYQIEVDGLFYQAKLTGDTDENFWSVQHPLVLVWAGLRQLELTYRNKEGAKDWEDAVLGEIRLIDFDEVSEEGAEFDQIEG